MKRAGYRACHADGIIGSDRDRDTARRELLAHVASRVATERLTYDDVHRVAASLIAEDHEKVLGERGFQVRSWPRLLRQRVAEIIERGQGRESFRLYDHPYALRCRSCGRHVLRAEPYGIGPDELRELARLVAAGWYVSVDARLGLHFPGATVVIEIIPPENHDLSNHCTVPVSNRSWRPDGWVRPDSPEAAETPPICPSLCR